MKFQVKIKRIDWIDQDTKEAEVFFRVGNSDYWAFSSPFNFAEGSISNIEIDFLESEDVSFESFFSDNRDKEMKIVPFGDNRTSYHCYGRIINVNPIIVDCGDMQFEHGEFTHDEKVIGEYVYFVISRLEILSI
ncbi:MAG: hypothetical protein MJZ00_06290 [Paludibacteraceae bacterium]|nr:hypothetical protein [Paludibacteraceae bacterium]